MNFRSSFSNRFLIMFGVLLKINCPGYLFFPAVIMAKSIISKTMWKIE
jgi:hypothetical protein